MHKNDTFAPFEYRRYGKKRIATPHIHVMGIRKHTYILSFSGSAKLRTAVSVAWFITHATFAGIPPSG